MYDDDFPQMSLRRRQVELLRAAQAVFTPERRASMVNMLVRMAKEGNVGAAKLLFTYELRQPR